MALKGKVGPGGCGCGWRGSSKAASSDLLSPSSRSFHKREPRQAAVQMLWDMAASRRSHLVPGTPQACPLFTKLQYQIGNPKQGPGGHLLLSQKTSPQGPLTRALCPPTTQSCPELVVLATPQEGHGGPRGRPHWAEEPGCPGLPGWGCVCCVAVLGACPTPGPLLLALSLGMARPGQSYLP